MHRNTCVCVHIYPGSPVNLEKKKLVAHALATHASRLFLLSNVFGSVFFRSTCFMFVLLILAVPRSFYLSEYEILTGADRCTKLLGSILFGRSDFRFGMWHQPLKKANCHPGSQGTSRSPATTTLPTPSSGCSTSATSTCHITPASATCRSASAQPRHKDNDNEDTVSLLWFLLYLISMICLKSRS